MLIGVENSIFNSYITIIRSNRITCIKAVNVILTFDPVWDKSMMSEEAMLELNLL